jgi:flagellar biosynthesis regulator FlaF
MSSVSRRDARLERASGPGHRTKHGHAPASALLSGAAGRLDACLVAWEGPGHDRRIVLALRHHRRLWTMLDAELARAGASLPSEVRVDLLRLARFIEVWTVEFLGNPDPARLRAMIEIDRGTATILSSLGWDPGFEPPGTSGIA